MCAAFSFVVVKNDVTSEYNISRVFYQEMFDIRAENIYNSLRCLSGVYYYVKSFAPARARVCVCDFLCMWSVSTRRQPEGHFAKCFALLLYRLCGSPWN